MARRLATVGYFVVLSNLYYRAVRPRCSARPCSRPIARRLTGCRDVDLKFLNGYGGFTASVFAFRFRLGNALTLPLKHDLAFPGRNACQNASISLPFVWGRRTKGRNQDGVAELSQAPPFVFGDAGERRMPGIRITAPTKDQILQSGQLQVTGIATGDRAGGGRIPEKNWPAEDVTVQVGSAPSVSGILSNYDDGLNTWEFSASIHLATLGSQKLTAIASLTRPDFDEPGNPLKKFSSQPFTVDITVGVGTSARPALALFPQGELHSLYAAWKAQGNDVRIYWSSFIENRWAAPKQVMGVGTSDGPALAAFNGNLYAVWKGLGSDVGIYWSSFDGGNWADQSRINGVGTSAGPSVAVFNNKLYAAWKGQGDDVRIYWSSFDGSGWANQRQINGVGTSTGPSVAAFNNKLYAAWKGPGNDVRIYWSSFDGSGWANQSEINEAGTSTGPSVAVFNNKLYAAWKGQGNDVRIYWSSFDGSSWANQRQINGVGTSTGPSLAYFDNSNRLYAAWKGLGDDVGIYWSSFDGSNWEDQKQIWSQS